MSRIALVAAVVGLPFLALQTTGQARAHAESKAESSAADSSSKKDRSHKSSSHSSSHRVVVVNGKTVVDEKIVDGKKLGGKLRRGARPVVGPDLDLDELLRRARAGGELGGLMDDLLRRLRKELPKGASVDVKGSRSRHSSRGHSSGHDAKISPGDKTEIKTRLEKMVREMPALRDAEELRRILDAARLETDSAKARRAKSAKALSSGSPDEDLKALRKKVKAGKKKAAKPAGSRKLSSRSRLR